MRLLFVLPELPHAPFTGAHTRPLTLLRAAAGAHEAVAVGAAPHGADLDALRALCTDVLAIGDQAARPPARRALAAARRAITPVPLLGRGRSAALAALVAQAVKRYRPQALVLETMYAVHYRSGELPAIVDLPDVVSGLCESAWAAHPLRYAAAGVQAVAARRAEPELLRGALPVTINDEDRARLARSGVDAFTVPLAVAPPAADLVTRPPRPAGAPLRMLFVGSYLHAPNREAARFLVGRLAPALRAAGLAFSLALVGRAAPPWLVRAAGDGVSVHSGVADLAPFYKAADVVVAPLAHGGGTKNKTLEAMAWALPVVGSPQAFTGVAATGCCVSTPLRPPDMAAALAGLAADPERRARMGEAARAYVLAAHSPRTAEARAAAVFDAVAAGGCVTEAEALWRRRA